MGRNTVVSSEARVGERIVTAGEGEWEGIVSSEARVGERRTLREKGSGRD